MHQSGDNCILTFVCFPNFMMHFTNKKNNSPKNAHIQRSNAEKYLHCITFFKM